MFLLQSSKIVKKNSKPEETSIVFPCIFTLFGPSFILIFQDFFCHLLSLSRTFSSNHVRVGLLMTDSTSFFCLRVSWFLLHSLRIIFPDMETVVDILFFFPVKMVPNLWWFYLMIFWCCCCSIAQSCLTLCDPMDCSWPGLPVPHYLWSLPKFMYVYRWCHPSISSSNTAFSCPQSFSASGTFPMSWLFPSDDQNTGTSASSSVLLTSIQGWFPWRLTGEILLSKGLSEVFSSTTLWRQQVLAFCLLHGPALTTICDCLEDHYNSSNYNTWIRNIANIK